MAASSSSMPSLSLTSTAGPGFYDKLNTQWHKRALLVLMIVVLAHWAEHLAQAVQVFVLGWPRPQAGGVLGLWFPWMVNSEVLHYGYAVVMLTGIWVLRKGFTGLSRKWWTVALVIQFWHHIEHGLLQAQAIFQHNLLGSQEPLSVLQMACPISRVGLHMSYKAHV